jgi:hypothetical protein
VSDTPNPPDITRDPICVITGATAVCVSGPLKAASDRAPVWVTLVPLEPYTTPDGTPVTGVWPRETAVPVDHEMVIGTVDDLTERFRRQLTKAFHSLAMTPPPGQPQPDLPLFGEPSLRKQTKSLNRRRPSVGGAYVMPVADPETYQAIEAVRADMQGFANRQDVFLRANLMGVVGMFCGHHPPTDDPELVQRLIDALVVLKEDRERQHQAAPTPPPEASPEVG